MTSLPGTFRAFVVERDEAEARVERGVREFAAGDLPGGEVAVRVAWSSVNFKDGLASRFDGKVARISPVVNVDSRTFEIEALVPNADHRLQCGVFAKAHIVTQAEAEALTAPLAAISSFAGVTKIFTVQDDKAHQVTVTLGARGDGWVEVIGDLKLPTAVITSGQSQLADGTLVEVRQSRDGK